MTRNGPTTDENKAFMALAKKEWLKRLAKSLPQNILDRKWPPCPYICREASQLLEKYYGAHLSRVYRLKLTPERKRQFELKVLAEKRFKGKRRVKLQRNKYEFMVLDKKKSYKASVAQWFENDRVPETVLALKQSFVATLNSGEKEVVCFTFYLIIVMAHYYLIYFPVLNQRTEI